MIVDRTGEKRMASCGLVMEIIRYRNAKDVDVRFSDGTIAERKTYDAFCKGIIAKPRPTHIGETRVANNGMEMQIVAYRNCHDIDVRFENGILAEHKTYKAFSTGSKCPPKPTKVGEKKKANCGLEMEIIAYKNAADIDVRFENGIVCNHQTYTNFKRGSISSDNKNKAAVRIGEKRLSNGGLCMEIIAYRNSRDIDVRFENGLVREHQTYEMFQKGRINPPATDANEKEVCKTLNCGIAARISAYRNRNDIDITFEDGYVLTHRGYSGFRHGTTIHPHIGYKSNHLFHGVYTKFAFRRNDKIYYSCIFPDGSKDILTPQEIMEKQGVKPAF